MNNQNTSTQPPQGVMAELRELLARATPGPWLQECVVSDCGGWKAPEQRVTIRSPLWTVAYYSTAFDEFPVEDENAANASLIVAAVNTLPGLLDEVEALRAQSNDWQARGWELGKKLDAAESRASALLARCEGLEADLARLKATLRNNNAADHTHECRACWLPYTPVDANEDCPACGCDGTDEWLAATRTTGGDAGIASRAADDAIRPHTTPED